MNCQTIRETIDTASRRAGYSENVYAHLGDCSACRRHADGTRSLFALLSAQPRVEAPADFDFRLRARIARAQAEPHVAAGLLEKFWTKSFSLGQAATAMAAVIVALSASTFYFTHRNEVATSNGTIAQVTTPVVVSSDLVATPGSVAAQPVARAVAKAAAARMTPVSYRSAKPQTLQPAGITTAVVAQVAQVDNSARFYSRAKGQFITASPNRDLIGAEGAGLAKSQPALSF